MIQLSIIFIIFASVNHPEVSTLALRLVCKHDEERLSTLILDEQKFSQNFISKSRTEQR